jgi:hypothetical protein
MSNTFRVGVAVAGVAAALAFCYSSLKDVREKEQIHNAAMTEALAAPPEHKVDAEAATRRVDELARRTGGDTSKLNKEELEWLSTVSKGSPKLLLKTRLDMLKDGGAEKKPGGSAPGGPGVAPGLEPTPR